MTHTGISSTAPAVFIGHGAPLYALADNPFTPTWQHYSERISRPTAVLVVSAHWYGNGLAVTAQDRPPTIHDFSGFGKEFFEIDYPAPGAPWLAERVRELAAPSPVEDAHDWGLDHGAWTVLRHLWPDADVPVAQLRIDARRSALEQITLGEQLRPLRDEGVMLLGSGNVVHNLAQMRFDQLGYNSTEAADWNRRFDTAVAQALETRDLDTLARWESHPDAAVSAPTPDHFWPVLVIAGAARPDDELVTITEGFDAWSLSMRSFEFTTSPTKRVLAIDDVNG